MTHLRLVENPLGSARPPEPRRLEVRLTVRDGPRPFGRSRAFRIHPRDIDELIAHASRMEARR